MRCQCCGHDMTGAARTIERLVDGQLVRVYKTPVWHCEHCDMAMLSNRLAAQLDRALRIRLRMDRLTVLDFSLLLQDPDVAAALMATVD